MSRLVCLDLKPGRKVRIKGNPYRISHVSATGPTLKLKPDNAEDNAIRISRSELAALLVLEEAELIDELEDPEADDVRKVSNLSFLPLHRILDWHGKVFLLRRMMLRAGSSPKSAEYRTAYAEAKGMLDDWLLSVGILNAKSWSSWTLYHDLQRWRATKYSLSAVQRKGIEYTPWQRSELPMRIETLVQEIALENPAWTIHKVAKEVNDRLEQSVPLTK